MNPQIPPEVLAHYQRVMQSHQENDNRLFATLKPLVEGPTTLEAQYCLELAEAFTDYEQIKAVVIKYAYKGWGRMKLYEVTRYVQFNMDLPDVQHEELGALLSDLQGYASLSSIIKLPQEPQDQEAFEEYFRKGPWL